MPRREAGKDIMGSKLTGLTALGVAGVLSSAIASPAPAQSIRETVEEAYSQSSMNEVRTAATPARAIKPKLRITSVRLLGAKRIRLVPGVWTKVRVRVHNSGRGSDARTIVRGSGKRIKVRKAGLGRVWPGQSEWQDVQVKLTAKKPTRVRFVVKSKRAQAIRKVRVRPRTPPPAPRSGKYRSPDGNVTFRIRKRKVTKFMVHALAQCNGPAGSTYEWHNYTYPSVRIPRNGIVDRKSSKGGYSVGLRMFVSRGKVTKGYFWYTGSRCWAPKKFTAKRK